MATDDRPIGVALSGGGHRAALFGLGVLMYLHDAEKHRLVNCITSVSGGSLTNAYVGQECHYPTATKEDFIHVANKLIRQIAHSGTLFRPVFSWFYLLVLAVSFVACLFVMRVGPWWAGGPLFVIVLGLWAQYILGARGWVCARAFGTTLFHKGKTYTALSQLDHQGVDHVLCATELHSGEHIYFSGRFIYSYRFGRGLPESIKLKDAVQASAAFPGGFPPKWMRAAPFQFQGGRHSAKFLVLSDGGVYDNMAEQWLTGALKRASRQGVPRFEIPTDLFLVNASASLQWKSLWTLGLPLWGEWSSFMRIVDTLYDNTTAHRRESLVTRLSSDDRMRGALVTIEQTPLSVASQLAADTSQQERANRAEAVVAAFSSNEEHWEEVRRASQQVKTTLRSLGPKQSANLLYHAYVVALANAHVIMGFPLLDIPPLAYFERLVSNCRKL